MQLSNNTLKIKRILTAFLCLIIITISLVLVPCIEIEAASLPTPSNIEIGNVQKNSCTVTWEAVKGADEYQVEYNTSPNFIKNTTNIPILTSENFCTLSNLTENEIYFVKVRSIAHVSIPQYVICVVLNDAKKTAVGIVWDEAKGIFIPGWLQVIMGIQDLNKMENNQTNLILDYFTNIVKLMQEVINTVVVDANETKKLYSSWSVHKIVKTEK